MPASSRGLRIASGPFTIDESNRDTRRSSMAWLFGGGGGKDQPEDGPAEGESRLSGKSLEIAQQIVRETLRADHQALERHTIVPSSFSAKKSVSYTHLTLPTIYSV